MYLSVTILLTGDFFRGREGSGEGLVRFGVGLSAFMQNSLFSSIEALDSLGDISLARDVVTGGFHEEERNCIAFISHFFGIGRGRGGKGVGKPSLTWG